MKEMIFNGADELMAGLGIYFILALAAAIFQLVYGGWRGVRHALSVFLSALIFGVMAGWICQHYHLDWLTTAAITAGACVLSNAIVNIIFHPAISDAIVRRLADEIRTRFRSGKAQEQAVSLDKTEDGGGE